MGFAVPINPEAISFIKGTLKTLKKEALENVKNNAATQGNPSVWITYTDVKGNDTDVEVRISTVVDDYFLVTLATTAEVSIDVKTDEGKGIDVLKRTEDHSELWALLVRVQENDVENVLKDAAVNRNVKNTSVQENPLVIT